MSQVQPNPKSSLSPILTITPPTLHVHLPTPPLTPAAPAFGILIQNSCSPNPQSSTAPKKIPFTPISPPAIPHTPDTISSLHYPLTRHLALLHPNTPKEVIHFIATRLLSPDIPHGHEGDWTPISQSTLDLSAAGVGVEARKGCKQRKEGVGAEVDRQLGDMYDVARTSWGILEMKSPGVSKI